MHSIRILVVLAAGMGLTMPVIPLKAQETTPAIVPVEPTPPPTPTPKKKLNLPKSGELAALVLVEVGVVGPIPWGSGKQVDSLKSPLLGSITQEEGNWIVRISNTSKDRMLNASFELAQYNQNGQKVKSDPFSYSLRPQESVERPVRATSNVTRIILNLTDWKEK